MYVLIHIFKPEIGLADPIELIGNRTIVQFGQHKRLEMGLAGVNWSKPAKPLKTGEISGWRVELALFVSGLLLGSNLG